MKKKLLIILFLTFFLLPLNISAQEAFDIKKYNVDINVKENNVLEIKEDITVYFNEPRHGIIREIPIINEVKNIYGTHKQKGKVKYVDVNKNYETLIENSIYKIKIGDADTLVDGEVRYKISYDYDLGKDNNKELDELYFNFIGNYWDTTIENVTFTVHMPKEFDSDKFGVSSGYYGYSGTDNININFEGNKITGNYIGTLNNHEGITLRVELPDGYFIRDNKISTAAYVISFIIILFLINSLRLWKKYGKDRAYVAPVEFYAPEGLNSAEVGYIKKLYADNKDIISLLIYLANKGYLRIEEVDSKGKAFKLIKVKDYDGDNIIEEEFLRKLFHKKDTVTKHDLENSFYKTINSLIMKLSANKYKYYEKKSTSARVKLTISIIFTIIFAFAKPLLDDEIMYFEFEILPEYIMIFIIATISIIGQIISFALMGRRTEEGAMLYGKIMGFKNFLETAEKDKLEKLVYDDPTYFYNILPFTYVLDISDEWIKKFESISMEPPEWYTSKSMDKFDIYVFNNSMEKSFSSFQSAMTSIPHSEGGSSSFGGGGSSWGGGGGFSGGGSGGGGGSSW